MGEIGRDGGILEYIRGGNDYTLILYNGCCKEIKSVTVLLKIDTILDCLYSMY